MTGTSATLSDRAREFVDADELAIIATIEPDGRPQQSPVWVKSDGDDIVFSTVAGRRKATNLARDPRVGVLIVPRDSPYTYLEVRGTATLTADPDGALIQELAQKYTGGSYTEDPATERLIVRVTPERVIVRV